MADFLDRLLARSVPGCPAPPGEAVVAPRLPQPFEQVMNGLEQEEFVAAPVIHSPAPMAPAQAPTRVSAEAPGRTERPEATAPTVRSATPASEVHTIREVTSAPLAPPRAVPPPTPAAQPTAPQAHEVTEQHLTTVNVTYGQEKPAGTLLPSSTTVIVPAANADARQQPAAVARRGEPEPPPPVRISIGRIEVKSAEPARQSPRTRPSRAEPAVSLERYLTREDGSR